MWDGVTVEDDVFIGPAVVFTNDLKPRSQHYPKIYAKTLLKEGCSIGANATIIAGIQIGKWSLVGAGSVVTKNIPNYGVAWGNPAKFQYWICKCTEKLVFDKSAEFICRCGKKYQLNNLKEVVLCP